MIPLAQPVRPVTAPLSGISADLRVQRLMDKGAYVPALDLLQKRQARGEADADLLDRLGTCLWHTGDGQGALAISRKLAHRLADVPSVWTKQASIAMSLGQEDLARQALVRARRLDPRNVTALSLLDRLDPIRKGSQTARMLANLSCDADVARPDRALAMNILGRVHDRAGQIRPAFRWFKGANALCDAGYQPRDITAMVAAQILHFDPDHGPKTAAHVPRVIFVTGMPRSGTTLVDRILSQHPDVVSMGETQALSRTVMAMRRLGAQRGHDAHGWDWFAHLTANDLAAFRAFFLSFLPPVAIEANRVFVCKMPLDCFDIGAAFLLLPGARCLHLERHPLDVGLSCFKTQFHAGNGFSRTLPWIGHMIRSVQQSSEDYERKLPDRFLRLSYRHLVAHPQEQIRRLVASAGLDWHEACLAPEQNPNPVRTASLGQVNAAITTAGLGQWDRYRTQLDPLAEALGGWKAIRAWEDADRDIAAG